MEQKHNPFFLEYVKPSQNLESIIINKISFLQRKRLFIKQSIYSLITIPSFIGAIYLGNYSAKAFIESGVYEYLLLIVSNINVLIYWKDLSLSIVESLPFLELSIFFGFCGLCLWSITRIMKIQVSKPSVASI
jgi:hypothetical protein